MRLFNKFKTWILLLVLSISLSIMGFLIYQNFKHPNYQKIKDQFDIKVDTNDETAQNLKPDVIFKAIDRKILAQSLKITPTLEYNQTNDFMIVYQATYEPELFEYYFLQQIIKVMPQWKNNLFQFSYNKSCQIVWVNYHIKENPNFLNWYFQIVVAEKQNNVK